MNKQITGEQIKRLTELNAALYGGVGINIHHSGWSYDYLCVDEVTTIKSQVFTSFDDLLNELAKERPDCGVLNE